MGIRHLGVMVAASGILVISCGGTRRAAAPPPSIATTVVENARVNASEVIRSCAGPSLCREDVLATLDAAALADIEESCARHGGTFGSLRCGRAGAAAKCSAGSEYGTVTVFAYGGRADSAATLSLVSKQCDAVEGAFEKMAAK